MCGAHGLVVLAQPKEEVDETLVEDIQVPTERGGKPERAGLRHALRGLRGRKAPVDDWESGLNPGGGQMARMGTEEPERCWCGRRASMTSSTDPGGDYVVRVTCEIHGPIREVSRQPTEQAVEAKPTRCWCGRRAARTGGTDERGGYIVKLVCELHGDLPEQQVDTDRGAAARWGDGYSVAVSGPSMQGGSRRRERAGRLRPTNIIGVLRAPQAAPEPKVDIPLPHSGPTRPS
jgi:hypothetical protein